MSWRRLSLCCAMLTLGLFAKEKLFLSTPEQIASLSSDAEHLIAGVISPLTGQIVLKQTDLIAKGAQDIVLSRFYAPSPLLTSFLKKYQEGGCDKKEFYDYLNNDKSWSFYPHLWLHFNPETGVARVSDPNGCTADFQITENATLLVSPDYAISNTNAERPGGQYDLRNTRISYEADVVSVFAPDATVRIYQKRSGHEYALHKEILPNGKILKYHYKDQLEYVESQDPLERYTYATLYVNGSPNQGHCHFTSSSGTSADYHYDIRPLQWQDDKQGQKNSSKRNTLPWFGRSHKSTKTREYLSPPVLTSVNSPYFREEMLRYCPEFLLEYFSGKEMIFSSTNRPYGEVEEHLRVHELKLPVNADGTCVGVYQFDYTPAIAGVKGGSTLVESSDGTSIRYHFSANLLTTAIEYFDVDGKCRKEKRFLWDEKNWLQAIEVKEADLLLYSKSFVYDTFGNPILETFTGNLTGEGKVESITLKRSFSQDGRNLLLTEENEEGKLVCFTYLPHTNLITSKLTKYKDKILTREFFLYDDCNNCIQKSIDDGSSEDRDNLLNVTQRTLTTYLLRSSAAFMHMPEWIITSYWEKEGEKLLNKKRLHYDQFGNINQEDIYDAQGVHAYSIYKTYNERGNLLSETNSLGQKALYTYDDRGRIESQTNFSQKMLKTFRYDAKGRLCAVKESAENGVIHSSSSAYDFQDRLISQTDFLHNTIHYVYDPFVNKVAHTYFPCIASPAATLLEVATHAVYDALGRVVLKIDANGNKTSYRYNAYGSVVEIQYPGGGKEISRYTKEGRLASYTDRNELTTHYTYDVLGRVICTEYFAYAKPIAEERFTYKGFNLLSKTDKAGNIWQYTYDAAGRKVSETLCSRRTEYKYDALGQLATVCKHNGDNTLIIHYIRDLEGRLIEERKTDLHNHLLYKISYSYDEDGNQDSITRYIGGKESVHKFTFDAFGRVIEEQDPQKHATQTVYSENCINALGQKVLKVTRINPLQVSTVETRDALGRIVKKETLNDEDKVIAAQENNYDPHGNLLYRKEHVYENGLYKETQTLHYTYTVDNQIESATVAGDSPDTRTTKYTYFPSGKMATKILPNGITLHYTYHPLGFLHRLNSSDDKISYVYTCDLFGRLISARDENRNITIRRDLDSFGNVERETFPFGLEVKKKYDHFNRLTCLEILDQGKVCYEYDPLFLRKVIRISPDEKVQYTHQFTQYDTDGNLISEEMIGNLGRIEHTTTINGQNAAITTPYFSQCCYYNSLGNFASIITDEKEEHLAYDDLAQLTLEASDTHSISYAYDSLYNRVQDRKLNAVLVGQESQYTYDLNGNLTLKKTPCADIHLHYDLLNQLVSADSEGMKLEFLYDPLGRRVCKIFKTATIHGWNEIREYYLYHDQHEIGAFSCSKRAKNLRILTPSTSPKIIAIELDHNPFAAITDIQGNVRRLIDLKTKTLQSSYDFTAFGELLQVTENQRLFNPWRYASKRFDPELELIYFGKRYYNPQTGRWLTADSENLPSSVR